MLDSGMSDGLDCLSSLLLDSADPDGLDCLLVTHA